MSFVLRRVWLIAALLTVVSRGSPLLPVIQPGNNSSNNETASIVSSINATSSNVSDNLLFAVSAADNKEKGETVPIGGSVEDDETCDTEPFCETEEHPVPDDIQLKVLERNFDRLRPFFNKNPSENRQLYRTPIFFDGDDEFVQACETKMWTIDRPREVRDIDGNRHFLLNPQQGGYRQSITLVRCSDEQEPCRNIEHILPPSRLSRCETRFWLRQMTAISQDTLEPYEITVKVPGSCNCYIKALSEYYSSSLKI